MKFIFPKNYNFKYKLLGFIDYWTAILDAIIGFVLFGIINIFIHTISTKIYIFIIIYIPILLFSIFGLANENLLSVIYYMFKFFKNRGVFLYSRNFENYTPQETSPKKSNKSSSK